MILKAGEVIFITDDRRTKEHFGNEQLLAEHNGKSYRISIDTTMRPPYYQLYVEWEEDLRILNERLYASSSIQKMKEYIENNL